MAAGNEPVSSGNLRAVAALLGREVLYTGNESYDGHAVHIHGAPSDFSSLVIETAGDRHATYSDEIPATAGSHRLSTGYNVVVNVYADGPTIELAFEGGVYNVPVRVMGIRSGGGSDLIDLLLRLRKEVG